MIYQSISLEFHRIEQLFDLVLSIDIYKQFQTELDSYIQSSNFNKYYDPQGGNIHPHIEFRFLVEERINEQINSISSSLDRTIIRYVDPEIREWIEPDFVVKAHEAGSMLAVLLVDYLRENASLRDGIGNKWNDFIAYFMVKLLISMGYNLEIIWGQLRSPPVPNDQMDELLTHVNLHLETEISKEDLTPHFLERFTHAFFNCTLQSAEPLFRSWVSEYLFWKNLYI